MAPRQLFTQPMEDDNDPEPGSKRVRPCSADEGSMQVRLRARASACGTPWPGPARSARLHEHGPRLRRDAAHPPSRRVAPMGSVQSQHRRSPITR
eukprot:scaffold6982_cov113-Isochrysis_galbana.AAC.3